MTWRGLHQSSTLPPKSRPRPLCNVLALLLGLSVSARLARAQDAGTTPQPSPEVVPPVLLEARAPSYPASELGTGSEPTIELRLTIDVEGKVTEVEVVESAGLAFDDAAKQAALGLRFSPARRDGAAVASRILYRVEFHLPAAEAARVEPPPPTAAVATPVVGAPPAPAAAATQVPTAQRALDVTVQGESRATRRQRSAEAVTVVELDQAHREASDLGEVLARTQGVSVRRSAGLGSSTGFSLNGLTEDQIRFFLDGIPLELQGYQYGIGNVPVNLIEYVEIYSGVVPVRYGADALGGAIDLHTDSRVTGTHGSASYQFGSFGTHRATLSGRHRFDPSGFFVRLNGFADLAKNDYFVDDVLVADSSGSEQAVRAQRFHDDYRAAGANVELGFVDRPWARRLLLRGFFTDYDQDIQTNPAMTIPYGGIRYGEFAAGGSLRYEHEFGRGVTLRAVTGYAYQSGNFVDVDRCVWNWLGECSRRTDPGETDIVPHDRVNYDHSVYGRYELELVPHEAHAIRLAISPTFFSRIGDEKYDQPGELDSLNSDQMMFGVVSGVEYELDAFDDRLENIAFVKLYLQRVDYEEVVTGGRLERDAQRERLGVGDAIRFRLTKELYAKLSYEYATRIPSPEQTFGDSVFIDVQEELLRPEASHNANLSLTLDAPRTGFGAVRGGVNGFIRSIHDLIVLLGVERGTAYQNVGSARSIGVEAAAGWTSIGEHLALDANVTYMDFMNLSETGAFEPYQGDRIPNRPYLFANASARFQLSDLIGSGDEFSLTTYTSYVHSFWLGWESIGSESSRLTVPSHLVMTLALGYVRRFGDTSATATIEADNLTDAQVYDYFGSQRPGRAFYLKLTIEH